MAEEMDLVLYVGPEDKVEILEAESSVLGGKSEWFKTILSGRWALKKTREGKKIINLPKDDPKDFGLFLKLLKRFTGLKLDNAHDFETVAVLQELAERYEVDKLKKNLAHWWPVIVKKKVKPANFIQFYNRAKNNGLEDLQKAVCAFFVKNIRQFWSTFEWLKLDEFAVKLILSDDRLYHWKAFKAYGRYADSYYGIWPRIWLPDIDHLHPLAKHLTPNLQCEKAIEKCESSNELLIFEKAMEWITRQTDSASNSSQSLRLLQHVRFGKMTGEDFMEAMCQAQQVLTTLQKGELVEFRLLGEEERKKSNFAFKPDDKPRIHLTPYRVCPECELVKTWTPRVVYRCDVVTNFERG